MKYINKHIILFLFSLSIFAQNNLIVKDTNQTLIDYKISDIFEKEYHLNSFNSSRYLKIITTEPTERFESPSSKFLIDGIPYDLFPLNSKSIDLIPLDNLQFDKVEIDNGINLKKKIIPDSLQIKFRGYVGSETGDPLIHIFTKPDQKIVNVDKIAPSGAFVVSNANNNFAYRFVCGYYGFYSTGYRNYDVIQNISKDYFKEPSRQIYLSSEMIFDINNEQRIILSGSVLNFYDWETPPFIGSLVHLETYLYAAQGTFENLFNGFSITTKYDYNVTQTHTYEYKFTQNRIMFIPNYNLNITKNLSLYLSSNLSLNGYKNIQLNNYNPYLYFVKEIENEFTFNLSSSAFYNPSKNIGVNILIQYKKNIFNKKGFSSSVNLNYDVSDDSKLQISASSKLKFPDVSELNGNFTFYKDLSPECPSELSIIGNADLKPERNNSIELSYIYESLNNTKMQLTSYFKYLNDPIYQRNLFISRTSSETNIHREAIYDNGEDGKLFGFNLSAQYYFNKVIKVEANYQFNDNKDFLFTPKHKLFCGVNFYFTFRGLLSVNWQLNSKEIWELYRVNPSEDYFAGIGFNGEIGMKNIFNVYYQQEILNFLFFKTITAKLSIENIFDNTNLNIPIGNSFGRAVVFGFESDL